jgi:effector-binding domain-containing protein
MSEIAEEIVKLAESGEVKTTNLQEVAFVVHKGSYLKLGEVFWKSVQWVEENGYEIVGPPVAVCHNDSPTAQEEEQVSECPFPVRKRR